MITIRCPLKFNTFLQQLRHRLRNPREIHDEPTIITGRSEKTPDFLDIGGLIPIEHILNFRRINSDTILRYDMPKKSHFTKPKLAFAKLRIEAMFSESFKHNAKMNRVLFLSFGIDKNIVDENHDEGIKFLHENAIHQVMK